VKQPIPVEQLPEFIQSLLQGAAEQRAQLIACSERTEKEAQSMAANLLVGAVDTLDRDHNIQYLVYTSCPYGRTADDKPLPQNAVGFVSGLRAGMSQKSAHLFFHGHLPQIMREHSLSFRERLVLALRVLFLKSDMQDLPNLRRDEFLAGAAPSVPPSPEKKSRDPQP